MSTYGECLIHKRTMFLSVVSMNEADLSAARDSPTACGTQKLSAARGTTCRHPALKKHCNCKTTEMMHLFLIFQKDQTFANSLKGKKNIDSSSTAFYKLKRISLLERNPNQQSQPSADTHTQTEKRDTIIANVKRNLHSQTFCLVHSWPHV